MIDSLMSPVLDWFVCFIIKEIKKKKKKAVDNGAKPNVADRGFLFSN